MPEAGERKEKMDKVVFPERRDPLENLDYLDYQEFLEQKEKPESLVTPDDRDPKETQDRPDLTERERETRVREEPRDWTEYQGLKELLD